MTLWSGMYVLSGGWRCTDLDLRGPKEKEMRVYTDRYNLAGELVMKKAAPLSDVERTETENHGLR